MLPRILCLLTLPNLAIAALIPGTFQPGQSHVTGIGTDGSQLFTATASWPLPAALQPTAPFTLQLSPSGEVMYAVRGPTSTCAGTEASLWRLGAPGDMPTQIGPDFCVSGGVAWYQFFDQPQQSERQVLALAESGSSMGQQRLLWVDLESGAWSWQSYRSQIESVSLTFAPSGTAALVKHDLPVAADHTLVDLCPSGFGDPLVTYVDAGATVSAEVVDLGTSYVARTSVPGSADIPLTDCLGGSVPPDPVAFHTLIVSKSGSGASNGIVLAPGVSCGSDCEETYAEGMVVNLTASPGGTASFERWTGDCSGTSPSIQVTMTSDLACTARFIEAVADLRVSLSTPLPVTAGTPSTIHAAVQNLGPAMADGALLQLQLPPGTSTRTLDARCVPLTPERLECYLDPIPVGSTVQPNIVVDLPATTSSPLLFSATVMGFLDDPDMSNNQDSLAVTPVQQTDLSVLTHASADPTPGDFFYVIEVENTGPGPARDAVVTSALPTGVSALGHGATASCTLASVAPGGTARVILEASADPALTGQLVTQTASVAGQGSDADPSNNQDSVVTQVGPVRPPYNARMTRLLDNQTSVAGYTPNLGTPVALSGDKWFYADEELVLMGRGSQAVPVITPGTTIPGQPTTFSTMFHGGHGPSVDAGAIALSPAPWGAAGGIWHTDECGLGLVQTADPDREPSGVQVAQGRYAYWASGTSPGLIEIMDPGVGVTTLVDDQSVRPNDGLSFGSISDVSFDGTYVGFWGSNTLSTSLPGGGTQELGGAIFVATATSLTTVADQTTLVPGSNETFARFDWQTSMHDGWLYFRGSRASAPATLGLYRYQLTSGLLQTIVDNQTAFPATQITMSPGEIYAAENDKVAFWAWDEVNLDRRGLYLWESGSIEPLLLDGELVDGRPVLVEDVAFHGMDSGRLAVTLRFLDDPAEAAVYVIDLSIHSDRLVLDVSPLRAGQVATLTATGAGAGETVYFALSTRFGSTCPAILGGDCLALQRPRVLGSATADSTGRATLTLTLPSGARGPVLMQAVIPGSQGATMSAVFQGFVSP